MTSTPLRGISDLREFFRTNRTPIYFISPTAFNLLGVDRWVRNFHYVTYFDSFDGNHANVFVPEAREAREFSSIEDICNYLLSHPEARDFFRAHGPDGRAVFVMFDEESEALAAEAGLRVAHPPAALRHRIDSKIVTTKLGNDAGVPSVPNVLGRAASYKELKALAGSAGLGRDLVVQMPYGDSGKTTFFIKSKDDWKRYAAKDPLHEHELKVMRRIDHRAIAVEAVLTRHGTLVGPLMNDITGHPELTPYRGGWAGNDYPATLTPEQKRRAREMTARLGDRLAGEGYRGFFEVDYLVDLNSDELYLGELNPRISGISSMTNVTAGAYADLPLFLFHLLEYLDLDYTVAVDEINERWSREAAVDVWSQIIIKENDDQVELLTQAPRTGIYRLEPDGAVSFRRWGNDWHGVVNESEAFYLRILAPGGLPVQGRGPRRAGHPGAVADRRQPARRPLQAVDHRHARPVRRYPDRAAGAASGRPARFQDDLTGGPMHPLDPLTADEFRRVAAILRRERGVDERWRYASIELREPVKGHSGTPPREALAVCWDRQDNRAYRAVVSLTDDAVADWQDLPGQYPNMTVDEWHECDERLRADPRLAEALARRGITDLSRVLVDVWAYGAALVPERYRGRRVGWGDVWSRASDDGNPYAHPVQGMHPIVDLNRMELLEIEDLESPVEPPKVAGEYLPALTGLPPREVKPLSITQPDGVSFTLDGNLLTWQNWRMRIGFNYREGLVLHGVSIADRPVAHRMSFAEMVVPYRDPTVDHYRRTAFDIGEWGLGFMTTSLELGCDCLGEIRYVDAILHDSRGEPYEIRNAICVHEEDNAILWKHVDHQHGAEIRRARRLVVSFHVTVANYEYLVYWRFYQDGNIECEVRATGIMVTSYFPDRTRPPYGTIVDERTYAPYHQHFIVARLDLDIDGPANTVYATESHPVSPSERDPYALGLAIRNTPLRTEADGRQDYDWSTQRAWKVVNDNVTNGLGTPVGYKLVPGGCFPPLLDPSSPVLRRAEVIAHTLWVTPYHPDERWPCGDFPNLSDRDSGLPVWTAGNRSIENTDVVLWYVFGLHHLTRPEDWPIMPVDTVSFWLKPFGFFDRNPTLDVPP